MRPLPVIAIFLFICLLNSCSRSPIESPEDNLPQGHLLVTLNQCTPVFSGSAVRVCFDSLLSDSRCPANATCVWMGFAACKFSLCNNGETYPFRLSTLTMPGYMSKDTIVAGYKVEFINLSPYPGTVPEPVPGNMRKAEVKVTKL